MQWRLFALYLDDPKCIRVDSHFVDYNTGLVNLCNTSMSTDFKQNKSHMGCQLSKTGLGRVGER